MHLSIEFQWQNRAIGKEEFFNLPPFPTPSKVLDLYLHVLFLNQVADWVETNCYCKSIDCQFIHFDTKIFTVLIDFIGNLSHISCLASIVKN